MSIYIQKISDIALLNKYTKWYTNICNKALARCSTRKEAKTLLGYVEGHHILPKGFKLGGEKDSSNIVFVTLREHFILHWLATKMFEGRMKYQMIYAIACLCNFKHTSNGSLKIFSNLHKIISLKYKRNEHCPETISKLKGRESKRKGRVFGKNINKRILSNEEKQRRADILNTLRKENSQKLKGRTPHNKGIPHSEEAKIKMRKPRSEEAKVNIREGIKRRDENRLLKKLESQY